MIPNQDVEEKGAFGGLVMDVMGVMAYEDVESPPLLLNSTYFHLRGPAAPF